MRTKYENKFYIYDTYVIQTNKEFREEWSGYNLG